MIDERDVREMLHRRADAVPTLMVDAPRAARRARLRLLTNGAMAVLAAVAIGAATLYGVDSIRSAPVPADKPTASFARTSGEVLIFKPTAPGQPGDLVAVNPETGEERVLVRDLPSVLSARWSADGRWVAYETWEGELLEGEKREGERRGLELWVMSASQAPRQVATDELGWTWSSTGAELAAIEPTSYLGYEGSRLSTIDPVTGESTNAGSIGLDADVTSAPVWSPDRTRFVFGARGGAIYSVDARSGESSLLVRLPGEDLDSVDHIAWSSDGAHIAVMNDLEPGDGRLYVMDADGSNVRVLLDDRLWFENVAWSPDGTRLAYTDGSGMIWVASMDGSAPTAIGHPYGAPCSGRLCISTLTWSPDGSQIASWNRVGRLDQAVVLSALDADGQGEAEAIDDLTYRSWDGGSWNMYGAGP